MNEQVTITEADVEYQVPAEYLPPETSVNRTTTRIVARVELPPDILAFEATATDALQEVAEFKRQADGLIFGWLGLDAATTVLPGLGFVYSGYGIIFLQMKAAKARCSAGTRWFGWLIGALDLALGAWPVIGDAVDALILRAHAQIANRIIDETQHKLTAIDLVREASRRRGRLDQQELIELRGLLFRGGRSERGQMIYICVWVALALMMGYWLFLK